MSSSIPTSIRWNVTLDSETPSQLHDLLDAYLAALERGEQPDREALVQAHPELADALHGCFAKLDALHAAAAGLHASPGVSAPARLTSQVVPSRLGDYRIHGEIGRGGMGVVYEAEQLPLGRRVALKTLPLSGLLDDRRIARFKNESIAAASLNHPHIVPIYAVGCDMGVHYHAMQCIDGGSLADVIAERQASQLALTDTDRNVALSPITSAQGDSFHRIVAQIGMQAADALDYAHQQGVVHRDVKPSNLLVDSTGHVWVTDFGLAATQADLALTRTGELLGTLRYLSPEQAASDQPVDHRVDIYGMGLTLYELLAGQPAQTAKERGQLLRDVIEKEPHPIRRIDPSIHVDLATVISKAISKEVSDRYATAGELAADLGRFLAHQPVIARRPGPWRKMISWVRRNRTVAVLLSVVACLLAAAAIGAFAYAWSLAAEQRKLQIALYGRDIALAQQLIERGERIRAEATLLKWTTTIEKCAFRDFEWFYLWGQCRESASDAVLRFPADAFDMLVLEKHGWIATSAFGTTIAMWDAETFEPLDEKAIRTTHQSEITKLAVDATEEIFASGGAAGRVCLWQISDGTLIDQFDVDTSTHGTGVLDMAFSPDGHFLAVSTRDQLHDRSARDLRVWIWDLQRRRVAQQLEGFGALPCVDFSPSGDLYITSFSGEVEVWTYNVVANDRDVVERLEQKLRRTISEDPIWCSDLSPDGRYLVTSSGTFATLDHSRFEVWDTATWQIAKRFDARVPGRCYEVQVQGDRWAALGGEQGHVMLLDLKRGTIAATRKVHHAPVFGIRFARDGNLLCSASQDNTIRFWDRRRFAATDRSTVVEYASPQEISGAIYANAPERVYIACHDGSIIEWDVSSRAVPRKIGVRSRDANRTNIDVSTDGRWLAVVRGRWPVGGIAHVELHSRKDLGSDRSLRWRAELTDGAHVARPRFAPDAHMLAVPSLDKIRLFSTVDGKVLTELSLQWVYAISFSSDGHLFAAARGDRTHIFRTSDWIKLRTLKTADSKRDTRAIDFSPDGQVIATSDELHRVTLWDVRSGRLAQRSDPLSDFITALFYSPNGRRLAVVTKDGSVNLMHSETLDPQLTLPMPGAWTFHGGFSDDGNRLVVGAGRVSRVYDAGGIDELKRLNVKQLRGPAYRQINALPSSAKGADTAPTIMTNSGK